MRKLLLTIATPLFCFAFLLSANSGSLTMVTAHAQEMAKPKSETVTFTGKVTAVSDTSLTIVDDQKTEHTVSVGAHTKITKAGKSAKAGDIKADDSVTVVAQKGDGDVFTAVSISVT